MVASHAALLAVLLSASTALVSAQDDSMWTAQGSASFYWHNRYHGCLAMASYGDYESECPKHFTRQSLNHQYPGNRNNPFEVVGKWGPTPKYKSEGFMVKVPEMNKILMVFQGQYGWQNYNATLGPLYGAGCDSTCQAHQGAIEAWHEVKAATNDMAAIKANQGNLVWSAAGHGFGGMIMQVAALELKNRGLLFSAHSFGSPPVFNVAGARRWDSLFHGDASQRTVSNSDSIPASIPYHGKTMPDGSISDSQYAFVNTGIHVWGNNTVRDNAMGNANMYGQNYNVCMGSRTDPRCAGGNNEADHYFYYTDIGTCCEGGWSASYNARFDQSALASDQRAYSRTATGVLLEEPLLTAAAPNTSTSTTSSVEPTLSPLPNITVIQTVTPTPGSIGTATNTGGANALANNNAAPSSSTGLFSGAVPKMAAVPAGVAGLLAVVAGTVALL